MKEIIHKHLKFWFGSLFIHSKPACRFEVQKQKGFGFFFPIWAFWIVFYSKRLWSPACQTSSIKLILLCQRLRTQQVKERGGGAFTASSFVFVPKGLSALSTDSRRLSFWTFQSLCKTTLRHHSLNCSVSILKKDTGSLQKTNLLTFSSGIQSYRLFWFYLSGFEITVSLVSASTPIQWKWMEFFL